MVSASSFCLVILTVLLSTSAIDGLAFGDFHCKVATCREFYFGLKNQVRHEEYVDTCYDTVSALLSIPRRFGKCLDADNGQVNPRCIHALARTIRTCIGQLHDVPSLTARFYCGYTLMRNCAASLGLEQFPLVFPERPVTDE